MRLIKKNSLLISFTILALELFFGRNQLSAESHKSVNLFSDNYDVLFINVDILRADYVGLFNSNKKCTPNIDRFFKNSIIFEQVSTPAGVTLISNAAVLTSRESFDLKIADDIGNFKINPFLTIAETLRGEGYYTVNINEGSYSGSNVSLDRGFVESYEFGINDLISKSLSFLTVKLKDIKDKNFFFLYRTSSLNYPYPYPLNRKSVLHPKHLVFKNKKDRLWIEFLLPYKIGGRTHVVGGPFKKDKNNNILYKLLVDGQE